LLRLLRDAEGSYMIDSTDKKNINKPNQTSRLKEIIKIRSEINAIETKKNKNKFLKSWFFEKINKIDKPLTNLTRRGKGKTKINKSRYEKEDNTTNTNARGS
jgi:hypothetical protein